MAIKICAPKAPPAQLLPPVIEPDVSVIKEHYPIISNKISALWGTIQLHKFLNQVIIDDRGNRQGFPQPVISALLRVYQYHTRLVPNALTPDDTWDHAM